MVLMASIMVSLTVFLALLTIYVRQNRFRAEVAARLSVYAESAELPPIVEEEPSPRAGLFRTRVLGRLLRRPRFRRSSPVQLERAGLNIGATEYLLIRLAAGLMVAALVLLILRLPLLALVAGVLGFFLPRFWLRWLQQRRLARIEKQLPEALGSISGGLRAGFGLMHAMQATAQTIGEPLAGELQATIRELQLGAGVDDALAHLQDRVGSYDLGIVVTAMRVQQRTGGNLAEILDNVAHIMRERDRIRGELKTMTSQARLSGWILTVLPVALAFILTVLNSEYMMPLFTEPLGRAMIGGAVVMNFLGFLAIRKILAIRL